MELIWVRGDKRYMSADGSGYRWTARTEADGATVLARIVTAPFGAAGPYRLTLSFRRQSMSDCGGRKKRQPSIARR